MRFFLEGGFCDGETQASPSRLGVHHKNSIKQFSTNAMLQGVERTIRQGQVASNPFTGVHLPQPTLQARRALKSHKLAFLSNNALQAFT
jgi:hypothetical protein